MTFVQRLLGLRQQGSPARGCRLLQAALLTVSVTAACAHGGLQSEPPPAEGGEAFTPRILEKWERQMVERGREAGQHLATTEDHDKRLYAQYYDAQWIFLRIADYTGEREPWLHYATLAEDTYKQYLKENDYNVAGYKKFPHGFYVDWKRYGDQESKQYLIEMSENAVYQNPMRGIAEGWFKQQRSREVAYAIQTYVLVDKMDAEFEYARLERLVNMALKHVEIWTTGNYLHSDPERRHLKPFMAGLTASALISYYEHTAAQGNPDERVPAALERLADRLWEDTWVANVDGTGYGAFKYMTPQIEAVGSDDPAPDLNMLIAPMYGWLYQHTGDEEYRRRGDAIFAGGVELAYLGSGKQFNQHYRSSFDYLMWRQAGRAHTKSDDRIGPAVARVR
ncbi:MAG: hypothetical protein WD382_04200 [Halofilum sp. (in: g-proteobacteria)]